jgi:hypothetical protein
MWVLVLFIVLASLEIIFCGVLANWDHAKHVVESPLDTEDTL